MLTVLVQFQLPPNTTTEDAAEKFRSTAPRYLNRGQLIRKYYVFDEATKRAGGCYLFPDRAAADALLDGEWRVLVTEKYGGPPEITYFETPVIVDNTTGEISGLE